MGIPSFVFEAKFPDMTAENDSCRLDQGTFREFYISAAPALRGYLCHRCGSVELAEDIMQEAFLKFLRTVPLNTDEKGMKGYLYRTADTLLIDNWRRLKRSRSLIETWFRRTPAETRKSDHGEVTEAFEGLKPQQQSLLWLAYVEGFDHREIAEATGVKEKSVKVLLFRARRALAAILEGK